MKMNKFTKTILISLITIFSASLLFVSSAQAVDPLLKVDFENTPLFSEANFLPGESVTRYADVTNNSVEIKKIGLNVIDNSGCSTDCLSDVLNLVVSENGTTLYSGSLANFYGAGEKVLSDLNTGATTKYYFSMTFSPAAGNTYQNSTANFDVKILFFGEESIGPEIPGGGGGVVIISGLEIYNEMANNIQANSVTITWDTNKQSTSRVIYSPYNVPHVLNPNNPPNYDYLYSTPEYDTPANPYGVTGSHTVHITGLSPGTTYYYRCVSHASPDTVSIGHSFTTKGVAGAETEEEEEEEEEEGTVAGTSTVAEGSGPSYPWYPTQGGTGESEEEPEVKGTTTEDVAKEDLSAIMLADIGSAIKFLACLPWWLILVLALYPLFKFLEKKDDIRNTIEEWKIEGLKRKKRIWFSWFAFLVILALTFYFVHYWCICWWLFIALIFLTLSLRFFFNEGIRDKKEL